MEKMIQLFKKSFLIGLILGVIILSGCGPNDIDPCQGIDMTNPAYFLNNCGSPH